MNKKYILSCLKEIKKLTSLGFENSSAWNQLNYIDIERQLYKIRKEFEE